jgi:uncharacterized repeat protein (TIGR01451 family)
MDTNIPRRTRATAFRRAGSLAVALLMTLSLVGPGATGVAATGPEGGSAGPLTVQTSPAPPIGSLTPGTTNPSLPSDVCKEADFGFVVDRSGSIGSASGADAAEKNGIKGFVDAFLGVGGSGLYAGTRFGGSSDTATRFTSGFVAPASFKTAVDGLPDTNGRTPTGAGITSGSGNTLANRGTAPNVLFVVTDGSPNVPDGGLGYPSNPNAWLNAANVAIAAANAARAAGWVVKAIYVGAPDSGLPFSSADDQLWVNAVMTQIGGGSFTQIANFNTLASALLIASGCPTATIAKTNDASGPVHRGDTVHYTITVGVAFGPADVTVSDNLPNNFGTASNFKLDGSSFSPTGTDPLIWVLNGLATGTHKLTYDVVVGAATATGNYVNTASITQGPPCGSSCSATSTVTVALVPAPILVVAKAVDKTTADPGAKVTYTLTVHNTGNADATGVTVTDNINSLLAHATYNADASPATSSYSAGVLTWSGQAIAAGVTKTYTFSVTLASTFPAGTTPLLNTVVVAGSNCAAESTDPTCSKTTTVPAAPILVVAKAVDKTTADPGAKVTYTLTVHNTGNADATGVTVTDNINSLLAHATYNADASPATSSYSAGVLTWSGQAIAAGVTKTYTFSVTLASSGWPVGTTDLPNTVVVANSNCAAGSDDAACSTDTNVTAGTDLRITKSVDPATINGGVSTPVMYTITVTNSGTAVTFSDVMVSDADLLTVVPFFTGTTTCLPSVSGCTWANLVGSGIDAGKLDAGQSFKVTVTGTANPNNTTDVGKHVNTADAAFTPGPEQDQATISANATLTVLLTPQPALSITKGVSLSAAGPFVASVTTTVGTTVYYRIHVSNTGNVPLTGVTLADNLFTLVCTIPTTLAVGASFNCDYSDVAVTGTKTNTATADSVETDSVHASASVTASVASAPDLAITKGVSLSAAGPFVASVTTTVGTTVYYRIHVSNTGNVPLTGVTLADNLFTLVCTIPTTLAVGASFNCDYSDVAVTGTTTNTATASATYVEQTVGPVQASATIVARTSSLAVAKAVAGNTNGTDPILDVPSAKIGDTLTFTLTYTLGNGPVTNAVITDVLPQGYGAPTAISNDGTGAPGTWNATTRTITWKWATLSASGTVSYKVVVLTGADTLTQPLTNVASIVSDQTAPASASREVAVAGQVLAATSTPRVTPPPTDTSSVPEGSGTGNTLLLVLLALAGFMTSLGILVPAPARNRRRNRRSEASDDRPRAPDRQAGPGGS